MAALVYLVMRERYTSRSRFVSTSRRVQRSGGRLAVARGCRGGSELSLVVRTDRRILEG